MVEINGLAVGDIFLSKTIIVQINDPSPYILTNFHTVRVNLANKKYLQEIKIFAM